MRSPESLIDPVLLKMLRCPRTKLPLRLADDAQVTMLNERIASGSCVDASQEVVNEAVQSGLVTEDGKWIYPIRDSIPTVIPEEAIALTQP